MGENQDSVTLLLVGSHYPERRITVTLRSPLALYEHCWPGSRCHTSIPDFLSLYCDLFLFLSFKIN